MVTKHEQMNEGGCPAFRGILDTEPCWDCGGWFWDHTHELRSGVFRLGEWVFRRKLINPREAANAKQVHDIREWERSGQQEATC